MTMPTRVPLEHYQPRRIAIIKPSALGDIVHALPVLTALRRRYPGAHIAWIVNRSYEPLLHSHPDLDETLPFDRHSGRRWGRAAFRFLRFLHRIRREEFDLAVDLQGLARSGLMAVATGAPRRVGLSSAREGGRWAYTDVIPVPDFQTLHAVDRYWLVVEALGAGTTAKEFRVPIADSARRWADDQLQHLPRPWLVFGVGARWITKRWPPSHFAVLAQRAQARYGGTAIMVGGPDETSLAQAVVEKLTGRACDWTGKTSLPQLAAILANADIMVANDTGPLHLAVALGIPVVAPYTCTQVGRTGPYGAFAGAVETTVWCRGSCIKKCSRLECMEELTPDRLWPILEERLKRWKSNRRSA